MCERLIGELHAKLLRLVAVTVVARVPVAAQVKPMACAWAALSACAKTLSRHGAFSSMFAKELAQRAIKRLFLANLGTLGELSRAHARIKAARGEKYRARGATAWRR